MISLYVLVVFKPNPEPKILELPNTGAATGDKPFDRGEVMFDDDSDDEMPETPLPNEVEIAAG